MKLTVKHLILLVSGLALSACSAGSSLLNSKASTPQAVNVPVGNALALPPDLQLQAPGQTSDAYLPNGPVDVPAPAPKYSNKATPTKLASANAALPNIDGLKKQDIFEQYGVSKVNADGTPRTTDQLREALRLAIIAKRRETNPAYGTIGNLGNLFKDQ
jgi:hypothetical protein